MAKMDDSGEYSCKISKQTDKTETTLTIVGASREFHWFVSSTFQIIREFVLIANEFSEYPYKFVKVLKSQQLVEKETVTMLCELDDAAGKVKWFKGDQEITADKRYD